ncbi:hypothetical protein QBC34DRAFT_376945 [Podospora aff. communis PSN243]|uniref:Uncharacterized protein n=1 Tax=Podospora aff. communis PSN243 TaxID=3040156 RepID=A0AAV9GXL8_9PEZI|nr:hypothetical protein QBC34DRAFT_376945 [Podospora aff. communis PSN243]
MGTSTSTPEPGSPPSVRTKLKAKLRAVLYPRDNPDQDELPIRRSRFGSFRTGKTPDATPDPIAVYFNHKLPNSATTPPPPTQSQHPTQPQQTQGAPSSVQPNPAYAPYEPHRDPAPRHPATTRRLPLNRPPPLRQHTLLPLPAPHRRKSHLLAQCNLRRTTSIPAPILSYQSHTLPLYPWNFPTGILLLNEAKSYLCLPESMSTAQMVLNLLTRWHALRAHISCVEPGVVRAVDAVDFRGVENSLGVRYDEWMFLGDWIGSRVPLFWEEREWKGERGDGEWAWVRKRKEWWVGESPLREVSYADDFEDVHSGGIIGLAL